MSRGRRSSRGQADARRFREPLYTIAEAARIVDVLASTLASWAHGYGRRFADRPDVSGAPVISCVAPASPREPSIPFVGLAEALVLAAFRRSGVAMQRIRPAIEVLRDELGVDHALASRRLYTDGAEVLFDTATGTERRVREAQRSNSSSCVAASESSSKRSPPT